MFLSILFLPLLSFLFLGFFGYKIGRRGACVLSTGSIGLAFLLSCLCFYEVGLTNSVIQVKLFSWFSAINCDVHWGFLFDSVTVTMLVVVTSISFLVHLYSTTYMEGDPHLVRFMAYLSLFTFFMLCLVTGDNFLQLFLGWEGVGVSSYLLINFWFTRIQANKAALKAIIVNRFGDFGLLIGLVALFYIFKSFNFGVIFALCDSFSEYYIPFYVYEVHGLSLVGFFFFVGAVGKSAQIGLHTWLPDAMEGPTPVSALIHAATMVTAGVFVLIRISHILEYCTSILWLVVLFGALTCFFAGTIGIFQNDLKRVIAYSTCSQLGYMVFACGLSNYSVAMFHLMNHAFFKALLFLSAGAVIHALLDEQDMRKMGGLLKLLPYTYSTFLIGSLALMGFPFTTGFYSKDVILEIAYSNYYVEGMFSYWFGVLAACCTAFYSYRLIYMTFLGESNFPKKKLEYVHDAPLRMGVPLFILAIGSIFVGYIFKDMFIGVGTNFWGTSIGFYNNLGNTAMLEAEFISASVKFFPVFLSIFFGGLAIYVYEYYSVGLYKVINKHNLAYNLYNFFSKKWLFDVIYNNFIVKGVLGFGYTITFKLLDRGILELMGPTGLVRLFSNLHNFFKKLQSGFIFNYIFGMVVSFVFFIVFVSPSNYTYSSDSLLLLLIGFFIFIITERFEKKSKIIK